MTLGNPSGCGGTITLAAACAAVAGIITFVTGSYAHWIPVLIGIAVGLWAVSSIQK